ncbi:MAG: PstS family phosphate ABC transporter substrate-binding protein [Vulcanimicrobiota bacterium]
MFRRTCLFFILILSGALLWGCGHHGPVDTTTPIKIEGSTTLQPLSSAWAEAFMKLHPELKVDVQKSGTTKGIEIFMKGGCDIVEASRRLSTEEIFKARGTGVKVEEFLAGFAMYSVAVNPKNPVSQLTQQQVKDIFLGKISNWKEVGGEDRQIEVLYRAIGANEYDHFLERFVNISGNIDLNNLPANFSIMPNPEEIVKRISQDEEAIGYFFLLDHTDTVKTIAIARTGSSRFCRPSLDDAISGNYPIMRPYFMYMNKNTTKPLKKYIDFIHSPEGNEITKKMHFVPAPEQKDVIFEYI